MNNLFHVEVEDHNEVNVLEDSQLAEDHTMFTKLFHLTKYEYRSDEDQASKKLNTATLTKALNSANLVQFGTKRHLGETRTDLGSVNMGVDNIFPGDFKKRDNKDSKFYE